MAVLSLLLSLIKLICVCSYSAREVAEGGVAAPWVVEAVDEVEDFEPGLVAGFERAPVDDFRLECREEALGERVVEASAQRPMLGSTPASVRIWPKKATLV